MRQIVSLFLVLVLWSAVLVAQKPANEETGFVYRYELQGGVKLHTSGWGGFFQYGKHKTYLSRIVYGLEFNTIKHPKEQKTFNPFYDEAKSYYYGKLNSVLTLRPFVGYRRIVFQKLREKGVEVSVMGKLGPALTFLKPVYLEIGYSNPSNPNPFGYDYTLVEPYEPERHDLENIFGRAPWSKGIAESAINPGLSAKASLMFDFGPKGESILALEAGIMADIYLSEVQIMANTNNDQVHLNLFINFVLGNKYF